VTPKRPIYGESALLTPANLMTAFRIVIAPVFIWLIVARGASWWTFVVGAGAGMSDYLDGIVARRHGPTRSGAFLDPLADKVAVLGAMFALVWVGTMALVPVLLILAREVWMTWYRAHQSKSGVSIPARSLPKLKTLVQDFAIAFCVFPPTRQVTDLQEATLWCAVLLTVVTGVQYYLDGRRAQLAAAAT